MTLFSKTLFLFLSITIFSCDQKKKEPGKSKYEIQEEKNNELDTLNRSESAKLCTKLKAQIGWDTGKKYTYQLEELFDSANRPITFIGEINDIVKVNNLYVLKLHNSNEKSYFNDYLAEVSLSYSQLQELNKYILSNNSEEGCFILKFKTISSSYPKLTSEVEGTTPDIEGISDDIIENASSYLTFDFSKRVVILKGELIDYYVFKKIEDEKE